MAEEQKTPVANIEAEQDVQNVLAELKESAASEKPTEDADEARIVAEAAKLGEKSEQSEEKAAKPERETRSFQRGGRFNRGGARQNNAKFDPSSQEQTDDPVQIRKQVEFYFSDSNLPMDKFLLSKVGGSANNAVPLELLHSFKRMRRFQPFSAIVEALKTAETVELTENDTAIKRKVPLPESVNEHDTSAVKVYEDATMARSIYVKGFGFGEEEPTTQLDIEALFAPHGPVNAIRLRRTVNDRTFKGSVFVEFADEDKQKAFLALEEKPQYKDKELTFKSKKDYCDEKIEEIKAGNVYPSQGRNNNNNSRGGRGGRGGRGRGGRGGRGRGRGGRDSGDRNERDWRERRTDDQKNGFDAPREAQKDSRGVPVVQSTQKRSREDEGGNDQPAKKVDAKE
ncbi:uncharacterized protein N7511_003088 [Penicillium nucicola]|uniref:uncharacterized protein n=1 Tax=Penicillium nucicola TaxID=1850975 RepID=UPI002545AF59|nr:uncharacterized protein N7511_003088 [Penicillium nucicola]KAJ5771037.1 hypothetical protein N7511_003088 [Penicillium nucicola]